MDERNELINAVTALYLRLFRFKAKGDEFKIGLVIGLVGNLGERLSLRELQVWQESLERLMEVM